MKITIYGSGYVGLVTGACFADMGNDVICMDVDVAKLAKLNSGIMPIYEPKLEALIQKHHQEGRLVFTSDVEEAVNHGLYQFIAVGTPPQEDGSADLQHVLTVAENIAKYMTSYRLIINKSTVPVGTADRVRNRIQTVLHQRNLTLDFDVASNPEFLKEGEAIDDFMKPDRIIVGTDNPRATKLLRTLYAPFNRNSDRFIVMDVRSAELTKYAANAMLATKISFMNELANIAECLGADIEKVRIGIGSDTRIGYSFIYPGCGYGGSCFPKDVNALKHASHEMGYHPALLETVEAVNYRQKRVLFKKILKYFAGNLNDKTIAVWGLAFKPNTNDMREAPSRVLLDALIQFGATVRAFDPEAMEEARQLYRDFESLQLCQSPYEALIGADALVIVTEWKTFRSPDFDKIKASLTHPVIFDGRNLYDPEMLSTLGICYYSIGRN